MNRISICVCSWVAWYISYHVLLTPREYRNGISAYICTFGLWNIAIIWTSQFGPLGCCSKCCCNCSRWRNECSNRCGNWNKRQVGPNCIRHTQYQATRSSEDRAASTRGMGLTFLCSSYTALFQLKVITTGPWIWITYDPAKFQKSRDYQPSEEKSGQNRRNFETLFCQREYFTVNG